MREKDAGITNLSSEYESFLKNFLRLKVLKKMRKRGEKNRVQIKISQVRNTKLFPPESPKRKK